MTVEFAIPGPPCPKHRPRFARGRTYTTAETLAAEEAVRLAWIHHGKRRIEGSRIPLVMDVVCVFRRPNDHFNTSGTLNVKGRREPYPHGHGDWDNLGKLVSDALNGHAYSDDAQVTEARVVKRWAALGELPATLVRVSCSAGVVSLRQDEEAA